MATQRERRNQTRRAILDAAIAVYGNADTEASLELIGERAGVTKGSIHYHFESRSGLLRALAEDIIERMEAQLIQADLHHDPHAWLRALLAMQLLPEGRLLMIINDELSRTSQLEAVDPVPYLQRRLVKFGSVNPRVAAAAIMQFSRELALKESTTEDIQEMMRDLDPFLRPVNAR